MQQRYLSRVIFYLSFLATLCQEMSFCLSCGEIDVKMRCVFGQRSTVLAFPNKMASKRWPCGAESPAKMIFQNDFFLCKINENLKHIFKVFLIVSFS